MATLDTGASSSAAPLLQREPEPEFDADLTCDEELMDATPSLERAVTPEIMSANVEMTNRPVQQIVRRVNHGPPADRRHQLPYRWKPVAPRGFRIAPTRRMVHYGPPVIRPVPRSQEVITLSDDDEEQIPRPVQRVVSNPQRPFNQPRWAPAKSNQPTYRKASCTKIWVPPKAEIDDDQSSRSMSLKAAETEQPRGADGSRSPTSSNERMSVDPIDEEEVSQHQDESSKSEEAISNPGSAEQAVDADQQDDLYDHEDNVNVTQESTHSIESCDEWQMYDEPSDEEGRALWRRRHGLEWTCSHDHQNLVVDVLKDRQAKSKKRNEEKSAGLPSNSAHEVIANPGSAEQAVDEDQQDDLSNDENIVDAPYPEEREHDMETCNEWEHYDEPSDEEGSDLWHRRGGIIWTCGYDHPDEPMSPLSPKSQKVDEASDNQQVHDHDQLSDNERDADTHEDNMNAASPPPLAHEADIDDDFPTLENMEVDSPPPPAEMFEPNQQEVDPPHFPVVTLESDDSSDITVDPKALKIEMNKVVNRFNNQECAEGLLSRLNVPKTSNVDNSKPAIKSTDVVLTDKVKPVFAPDAAFDINEFCERTGSHAADHKLMFFNQKVAMMPATEAAFIRGMRFNVNRDGVETEVRVKNVNQMEVLVSAAKGENFTVKPWELTCNDKTYSVGWTKYVGETYIGYVNKIVLKEHCNRPLHSFIKIGHIFELIDEKEPTLIHNVEVISNNCGFLEVISMRGREFSVHMADVRCKPIGFLRTHSDDFTLVHGCDAPKVAAYPPPFVFDVDPFGHPTNAKGPTPLLTHTLSLSKHRFEVGHLLTVIDSKTNLRLIPAYVSRKFNSYFFEVTLIEDLYKQGGYWNKRICWAAAPHIFPFLHAHRDKCGTALPNGISSYDKLTIEELNHFVSVDLRPAPITRFPLPVTDIAPQFAWDDEGDETPETKNKLQRNLVEVLDDNLEKVVHIGRVIRMTKHFVFVSLESYGTFTPPRMYRFSDPRIVPLGTAHQCGWNVIIPAIAKAIPPKKQNTESIYSCDPLKTITVTEDSLIYRPSYLAKDVYHCPKIYVNKCCFRGPFIEENRVWRFANVYGDGPLEKVLEDLVSDLSTSGFRQRILNLLDSKQMIDVKDQRAKFYKTNDPNDRQHSSNCETFSFVTCLHPMYLHFWLNIICRTVDACPGYLSLVKRDPSKPCIFGCHRAYSNYATLMLPDVHVNTAYLNYLVKLKAKRKTTNRKRKTVVEQLREIAPKRIRINRPADFSDDESREPSDGEDEDLVDVDAPRQLRRRTIPARAPSPVAATRRPRITRRPVGAEDELTSAEELSEFDEEEENLRPTPADEGNTEEGETDELDVDVLTEDESAPSNVTSEAPSRQNSAAPQPMQNVNRLLLKKMPTNVMISRPSSRGPVPSRPSSGGSGPRPSLDDQAPSSSTSTMATQPRPIPRPFSRQDQRIVSNVVRQGPHGPILMAERRFVRPANPDVQFTSMRNGGAKIRLPISETQGARPQVQPNQYPPRPVPRLVQPPRQIRPVMWQKESPTQRITVNRMGGIPGSSPVTMQQQSPNGSLQRIPMNLGTDARRSASSGIKYVPYRGMQNQSNNQDSRVVYIRQAPGAPQVARAVGASAPRPTSSPAAPIGPAQSAPTVPLVPPRTPVPTVTAKGPVRYDKTLNRYVSDYSFKELQTTGSATIVSPQVLPPQPRTPKEESATDHGQSKASTSYDSRCPPIIVARNSSLQRNPDLINLSSSSSDASASGTTPRSILRNPSGNPESSSSPAPPSTSRSSNAIESSQQTILQSLTSTHAQKTAALLNQLKDISSKSSPKPPSVASPAPGPSTPATPSSASARFSSAPTTPEVSDPQGWSFGKLADYISITLKDPSLSKMIRTNEINGAKFITMTKQNCFTDIGFKLGPALKLSELAKQLAKRSAECSLKK